jgi:hypothetical protein
MTQIPGQEREERLDRQKRFARRSALKAGTPLPTRLKFLLAFLGALGVCIVWFLKQYDAGLLSHADTRALDTVMALGYALIMIVVSVLAGFLTLDSLETIPWRIVLQGVAWPSAIIGVLFSQVPKGNPFGENVSPPPSERRHASPTSLESHANVRLLFSSTGAQPVLVSAAGKLLPRPSFSEKIQQGARVFLGHVPHNWVVDAGTFPDMAEAQSKARELKEKGFTAAEVYVVPETNMYVVTIGVQVSPQEARVLQAQAEAQNIPTKVWQLR